MLLLLNSETEGKIMEMRDGLTFTELSRYVQKAYARVEKRFIEHDKNDAFKRLAGISLDGMLEIHNEHRLEAVGCIMTPWNYKPRNHNQLLIRLASLQLLSQAHMTLLTLQRETEFSQPVDPHVNPERMVSVLFLILIGVHDHGKEDWLWPFAGPKPFDCNSSVTCNQQ